MSLKNTANWLLVMILTSFYCMSANAEVIFQDNFDGDVVEPIPFWPARGAPDPDADWITIYGNLAFQNTNVSTGGGELLIRTDDNGSGVISPARDEFDFFNRELTYTFAGISIEALGQSRLGGQWVQFGVVANSDRNFWSASSSFIIAYNGLGAFEFRVRQPIPGSLAYDTAPRKLFKSTAFNFDISFLREIQFTLDSVNFRVAFIFENDLDRFQFGGPHNLSRDEWFVDTIDATYAQSQMTRAERNVTFYQGLLSDAQAANDLTAAANAQREIDTWEARRIEWAATYAERALLVDGLKGDSALLIAVNSDAQFLINSIGREAASDENGDVGARVSVGSVTVETTTILEGL